MKYEVIARRYRPRKFEEVVGQESIAQTLRGGIVQDRMAHAYLFAGPRGVGKTSMARIFSKAINCLKAIDRSRPEKDWARPCDKCGVCAAVHTGQDIDVIELDGASHRGIDDIRSIIEGVNRPASRGNYKVYLIDEVHMLTREAFNALLKTLEEPPAHVKFIFATTEAHKIPDTVLSRCQRFDFQPIREEDTVKRLAQICKAEKRKAPKELLGKIARYSRGGMRDSQTLLDQLMTYCEGDLTGEGLDRLTGRVSTPELDELLAALVGRDASAVLESVRACLQSGADPSVLVEQVLERLHEELVGVLKGLDEEDDGADNDVDRMIGCLQILLGTASQLRSSAYPAIAVEVALVKLARLDDPRALDKALDQLMQMEQRVGELSPASTAPAVRGRPGDSPSPRGQSTGRVSPPGDRSTGGDPEPQAMQESGAEPDVAVAVAEPPREAEVPAVAVEEPDFQKLSDLWNELLQDMEKKSPSAATFLSKARLEPSEQPGEISIFVSDPLGYKQLLKQQKNIQELAGNLTGASWVIRFFPSEEDEDTRETKGSEEGDSASRQDREADPSKNPEIEKTIQIFNGRLM
ncbi:MAG: DNA polymerase III subunit gamma/tau [Planctomycetota bacterium]|nr:DNA polymerase III subunit gamma/tau [Planctomycetota bacterium]